MQFAFEKGFIQVSHATNSLRLDLYSGSELTRILDQVGLPDNLGSAMTKWKRLAAAPPCKKNRQASKMAARWSG